MEKVLGQDRKALPAHDCPECERFYKNTGIPLNQCGRHRSKFKLPESPEGFWDVDIKSQVSLHVSSQESERSSFSSQQGLSLSQGSLSQGSEY